MKPVTLKPLSERLEVLKGKSVVFYYSWQEGSFYDGRCSDVLEQSFSDAGMKVNRYYKRKAFDQNDVEERAELSKYDAVVYFGASSCSTSKFAAVYGGLMDSEESTPTVVVTYETFKKDCEHANYENGTNTRCIFSGYPGDSLSEAALSDIFSEVTAALTEKLTEKEIASGVFEYPASNLFVEDENPAQWLIDNNKTDCSPVVIPTVDAVNDMLLGTSLDKDTVVSENTYPNKSIVNVLQVSVVAVMAGLKKEHLPLALAMVEAYGKAPLHACVISTNSFGFMPVVRTQTPDEYQLNYQEHALSSVPNAYNAPLGRFLRLLQIAIGGWLQGEVCFGVTGSQTLGAPAVVENPEYILDKTDDTVSLAMGFCSQIGNFMNMPFERLMDVAKRFDYQTGLTVMVSPKRADELIDQFGTLKDAGIHYQKTSLIPLKEFWEEWHMIFTKPQLELGAGKGELQGYAKDYLRYFEDKSTGDDLVPAFPAGSINFVVTGGSASKMMKAFQASIVTTVSVNKYK